MNSVSIAGVLSAIFFDQVTKFLARKGIFFSGKIFENPGLPLFGFDLPGRTDLVVVFLALFGFLILMKKYFPEGFRTFGFGLVIGGAVSNIFDRLATGTVTDFLNIGLPNRFNFADVGIVIGLILMNTKSLKSKFRSGNG